MGLFFMEGEEDALLTLGSARQSNLAPGRRAPPKGLGHQISIGMTPDRDTAQTLLLQVLPLRLSTREGRPPHPYPLRPAKPPEKKGGGTGRAGETLKLGTGGERRKGEKMSPTALSLS